MTHRIDLLVSGMTCEHCAASVTEEVTAIEGVDGVEIAVNPGGDSRVGVDSSRPLDEAELRAAIEEAGYRLESTGS